MAKYLLLVIFACSILTSLSGFYAMLLAYIFLAVIGLKDLIALAIILYSTFKLYKIKKANEKSK